MTTLERVMAEIAEFEERIADLPNMADAYAAVRHCLEIIDKYAEQYKLTIIEANVNGYTQGLKDTQRQSCENCKILELLVDMEIPTICEDDYNDCEYCENNCNFKAPTKACYLHWAEYKRKAVSK